MYHATTTGGEDILRKHMTDVIEDTPGYAIGDRSWRPPSTWAKKKQMVVENVKDWLVQATPDDKSGTVTPVVEVAKSTFSIFTTTNLDHNPSAGSSWRGATREQRLGVDGR